MFARMLSKLVRLFRRRPVATVRQTVTALLLAVDVGDGTDGIRVVEQVVPLWTIRQRRDACRWAWLEHLAANDNDVRRVARPDCVAELELEIERLGIRKW